MEKSENCNYNNSKKENNADETESSPNDNVSFINNKDYPDNRQEISITFSDLSSIKNIEEAPITEKNPNNDHIINTSKLNEKSFTISIQGENNYAYEKSQAYDEQENRSCLKFENEKKTTNSEMQLDEAYEEDSLNLESQIEKLEKNKEENEKMRQELERKNAEIERKLMELKRKQEKKLDQKMKKEKEDED